MSKYFNVNLKYGDDEYVSGLVFSTQKQQSFVGYETNKSPVKINKYTISTRYSATNVLINQKSVITETSSPAFSPDEQIENKPMEINEVHKIAPEQSITIKGKIIYISAVKKIVTDNNTLNKQELEVADPSGSIKIILWAENCSAELSKNSTYEFKNFKVKMRDNFRYLNTPKNGESSIKEVSAFADVLEVIL